MTDAGLQGKVIVNTRAVHQAAKLDAMLRAAGATPLSYPCIAIQPPAETRALDCALHKLQAGEFDWLLLTSANTVESLAQRLHTLQLSLAQADFKTAVVGEATAEGAQEQLGLRVDLVPEEYVAEALAEAVLRQGGGYIFLPESVIARPTLAEALRAGGATVEAVTAYETLCASGEQRLVPALESGRVDAITFTSSSTVTCLLERLRAEDADADLARLLGSTCIACIGSKTAATAEESGLSVDVMPEVFTLEGLLAALESYFV